MKNIREISRGDDSVALEFLGKGSKESITLLNNSFYISAGTIIGDYRGGNYSEIDKDGSLRFKGNATIWDDLTGNLLSLKLASVAGKLDYNYEENSITMQSDGNPALPADRLIFNVQKLHAVKADSEFCLHIHWWQLNTDRIEWQIDYRIQGNNEIKVTDWTTMYANSQDSNIFTYPGSGTFNQITELGHIDWGQVGISATLQLRITRIDDTINDIEATFIDGHVEYDSVGSRLEYVK